MGRGDIDEDMGETAAETTKQPSLCIEQTRLGQGFSASAAKQMGIYVGKLTAKKENLTG